MKKYGLIFGLVIIVFALIITSFLLYYSPYEFNFDSSKLSFYSNSKKQIVTEKFNNDYELTHSLANNNSKEEEEVKEFTKKVTYLLLGDFNNKDESSEEFYKRKKDFYNLGTYKYFPSDYDDEELKAFIAVSSLAIPQLFLKFNERGIIYNSYGDIRVVFSDKIIISCILLPDVYLKEDDDDDPLEYKIKKDNLLIYYYFIKVDDQYTLAYYYGENGADVSKYFDSLEDEENKGIRAIASSYDSNLSTLYNFDKLDALTDEEINNVYNSNSRNIVYINSYYNNKIIASSNGIFINDGLVLTTWSFMEKSLINSQYFTIKDSVGNIYDVDGIVTANPETDVVVIKLKEKNGFYVNLGDLDKVNIEDPAITLTSKSGIGLTIQKGIILSLDDYIKTSIPLSESDEGSALFDKNGLLIGLNSSKLINSNISMSINVDVIREIQDKFKSVDFKKLETISFEKLKDEYYYVKYTDEKVINSIPKSVWKKYKKIGNIEKKISLELVKASYKDGIVSLRYKNNISNIISNIVLSAPFREQLVKDGYKEVLNSPSKYIYENGKYKVVIISEFDYLIVMMVKL